eukprot:c20317_g2_i1.p1 GENE.c20317_g2_i1~~c20317_g2_i1.p1  ORF type:complete len:1049 (-),score=259.13 c20317_g2_i1:125-2893(-)
MNRTPETIEATQPSAWHTPSMPQDAPALPTEPTRDTFTPTETTQPTPTQTPPPTHDESRLTTSTAPEPVSQPSQHTAAARPTSPTLNEEAHDTPSKQAFLAVPQQSPVPGQDPGQDSDGSNASDLPRRGRRAPVKFEVLNKWREIEESSPNAAPPLPVPTRASPNLFRKQHTSPMLGATTSPTLPDHMTLGEPTRPRSSHDMAMTEPFVLDNPQPPSAGPGQSRSESNSPETIATEQSTPQQDTNQTQEPEPTVIVTPEQQQREDEEDQDDETDVSEMQSQRSSRITVSTRDDDVLEPLTAEQLEKIPVVLEGSLRASQESSVRSSQELSAPFPPSSLGGHQTLTRSKREYVFVSFASRNTDYVTNVIGFLKKRKYDVWIPEISPYHNLTWPQVMRAIDGATALLLDTSMDYRLSPMMRAEASYALQCGVKIIAIAMDESGLLGPWMWLPRVIDVKDIIDMRTTDDTSIGAESLAIRLGASCQVKVENIPKKILNQAVQLFNEKPKQAMEYLIQEQGISGSVESIARFLYETPNLNKSKIGEYIGGYHDLNRAVCHAFADLFAFESHSFDDSLRLFLDSFNLPGEAQVIDRIMEQFARRYSECDATSFFSDPSTVFVLAFSVIMLNTDLHNPGVKKKMTKEQFVSNNRGIHNGKDLPPKILGDIYDRILNNELKLSAATKRSSPEFVFPQHQGWLMKEGGKMKSVRKRWFVIRENCMFYFKQIQAEELIGTVPLVALTVEKLHGVSKHGFGFKLVSLEPSGKVKSNKRTNSGMALGSHDSFVMYAATQQEREDWVAKIKLSIVVSKAPAQRQLQQQQLQQSSAPNLSVPSRESLSTYSDDDFDSQDRIKSMDVAAVSHWLRASGFAQFVDVFQQRNVDGGVLAFLHKFSKERAGFVDHMKSFGLSSSDATRLASCLEELARE